MRRGKRAADTQNHTAFTRARNRSIPRGGDNFKFRDVYMCISIHEYKVILSSVPPLDESHTYSIIYTHAHVTTQVYPP